MTVGSLGITRGTFATSHISQATNIRFSITSNYPIEVSGFEGYHESSATASGVIYLDEERKTSVTFKVESVRRGGQLASSELVFSKAATFDKAFRQEHNWLDKMPGSILCKGSSFDTRLTFAEGVQLPADVEILLVSN
jgi:hypothetical protein